MQVRRTARGNIEVMALGEALESIDHRDPDILGPPVAQLGHHPRPEFRAFSLLDPKPQDFRCGPNSGPPWPGVNAELSCHFFADADVPRLTNSLFIAP
jgi:hypothetical protein